MSKEEVIDAIRKCAAELGRAPTCAELNRMMQITRRHYQEHFANYTRALREAGCETRGGGFRIELSQLFTDWAAVARKAGKLPTLGDYQLHGKYSHASLTKRFRTWREVPYGFRDFCERNQLTEEYADLLQLVAEEGKYKEEARALALREYNSQQREPGARIMRDRPVYGPVLGLPGMRHEPLNEQGVIYLFGILGPKLGFEILRIQEAFPDCEALREVEPGKLQRVKIEFEYQSKNFLLHGHDWSECDLIVCWEHNWPECPVEVLELKRVIGN